MSFDKDRLPDPINYYGAQGLTFRERKGRWRTTRCEFHGGIDSMRINVESGAFVCMAGCGARGGDVLSYHQAAYGLSFIAAARELGAWTDDGKPAPRRPTPFSARAALQALAVEANVTAVAASNLAAGVTLTRIDLDRLLLAAGRILKISGVAL